MKVLHQIIIFLIAFFISEGLNQIVLMSFLILEISGKILQDPLKFLLIWVGLYFLTKYTMLFIEKIKKKKKEKKKVLS